MRMGDWMSDGCSSDLPGDRHAPYAQVTSIELPGRRWTLHVEATPEFVSPADRYAPLLVALGGLLGSLLLYMTVRGAVRWRQQAVLLERAHREVEAAAQAKSRSEEHTSELQSLMRHSYAVFCL